MISNELIRYLSTIIIKPFDIEKAYMAVDPPENQPREHDRRIDSLIRHLDRLRALRREFESQIIGQEAVIFNQLSELRRLNLRDIRTQYTNPVYHDALSTESSETEQQRRVETFERFADAIYEVTVSIDDSSEESSAASEESSNANDLVFAPISSTRLVSVGSRVRITNGLSHISGAISEADRLATVLKVNRVRVQVRTDSGEVTSRIRSNLQIATNQV